MPIENISIVTSLSSYNIELITHLWSDTTGLNNMILFSIGSLWCLRTFLRWIFKCCESTRCERRDRCAYQNISIIIRIFSLHSIQFDNLPENPNYFENWCFVNRNRCLMAASFSSSLFFFSCLFAAWTFFFGRSSWILSQNQNEKIKYANSTRAVLDICEQRQYECYWLCVSSNIRHVEFYCWRRLLWVRWTNAA